MLTINVEAQELVEETQDGEILFSYSEGGTIELEHSLVSVSKWESKFHRSFVKRPPNNSDELLEYIRCMVVSESKPGLIEHLSPANFEAIDEYIHDPMTATYMRDRPDSGGGGDVITSELIYYWMIQLNIPFECQHWHFKRLMTLIKLTNAKNNPSKVNPKRMAAQNRALNAKRKAGRH